MNGKNELAEACRENDHIQDTAVPGEGSPMPTMFRSLNIEPEDAFYVAEQRALRVLAHTTGRDPRDITRADLKANEAFMAHAGAMFLDGLAVGARVTELTPEQLAAAMLLPLYDALTGKAQPIGEFSDAGDAARLELAKAVIERIHGVLPPSEEGAG